MNRMHALILAAVMVAAGCHSYTEPPVTTTDSAVSSSVSAPGSAAERQDVMRRFTQHIWPAVEAYNGSPGQGGPIYRRYIAIRDKTLDTESVNNLRDAVQHLGVVRDPDETQGGSMRDDDLLLADAQVTALNPSDATLRICYTFTALSYPTDWDHPMREPTASEATVELHKTDDWYLRAITNDHIVSNCPASNFR